jgi:sensor c-di-GMP phosphodiesterase-like protein
MNSSRADARPSSATSPGRWQKARRTMVAPAGFIELAEATGLAWPMTLSLMRRTRRDLDEVFGQRPKLKISFNLFNAHFASLKTVREVESIFAGSRIAFSQLVFEVTERRPIDSIKRARVVIKRLQELGARVALDDAGAGHAGLAYLHQLGVDSIKIDKLFVDTITKGGGAAPIVDSLVKLGHDLGMEVVAEGVETFEQLEYLRAKGADSAQGFLFSPPLPGNAFRQLVEAMEPLSRPVSEFPVAASNAPRRPAAKVA